jgi:hypothetical protein
VKYAFVLTVTVSLMVFAYRSAKTKIETPVDLHAVQLGMTSDELEENFGHPDAQNRNQRTYILEDSSKMIITLRDDVVASARVEFHHPIKIEDPKMRQLTLVQMEADSLNETEPSWFFAGKPEEGLIYKITSAGSVESLTWVPPFTYSRKDPKNLQALLEDFKTRTSSANL